jgi:chromosome segregation ATPase
MTKGEAQEVRSQLRQHESRVRELEEQIQSDDRVENLEISLKGTQERAESLEYQLTKSKQVCILYVSSPFIT